MCPYVSFLGLTLPVYGLMGVSGFLLGMLYVLLRAPRFSLSRDDAAYIYVFSAIGAVAGAKLLYILTVLPELRSPEDWMNSLRGGLVFYGGLIGAIPAAYLSARAFKCRLRDFMPVLTPCAAIIGCLGRIGCFFAGCCYGTEWNGRFSVVYPDCSLGAPAGVPLLPVQLIESAVQLALFLTLDIFCAEKRRAQYAAELYLICYSCIRFVLEFFRGDAVRGFFLGLSTSQWLSAIAFSAASLCLFMRGIRKKYD